MRVAPVDSGGSTVCFDVDDCLRTHGAMLIFLPVSPWQAPAYKPMKAFSEYLRQQL